MGYPTLTLSPLNADEWLGALEHFADLHGGNSSFIERFQQPLAVGSCDQQTSGGLRVEQQAAHVFGNGCVIFHQAFGEVTIVFEAAGDIAGAHAFQRAVE